MFLPFIFLKQLLQDRFTSLWCATAKSRILTSMDLVGLLHHLIEFNMCFFNDAVYKHIQKYHRISNIKWGLWIARTSSVFCFMQRTVERVLHKHQTTETSINKTTSPFYCQFITNIQFSSCLGEHHSASKVRLAAKFKAEIIELKNAIWKTLRTCSAYGFRGSETLIV
jgi:hypothetical protein